MHMFSPSSRVTSLRSKCLCEVRRENVSEGFGIYRRLSPLGGSIWR